MRAAALCFLLFMSTWTLAQDSKKIYLSGRGIDDPVEWEFLCSDGMRSGSWERIGVPSCWEQEGFGAYNYGHMPFDERLKEVGRYRHRFFADASWKEKVVELHFAGVMTDALVLINGKQAGKVHQGAFYPFHYDISKLLIYGAENELEVLVSKFSGNESVNQAERKADYWVFGGIFRPVWLEVHPRARISYAAIDARAGGQFSTLLEVIPPRGGYSIRSRFMDMDGSEITSVEISCRHTEQRVFVETMVPGIQAWNPESPKRYQVEFSLVSRGKEVHSLTECFGFRTIEVREADGIYLNGVRVKLKGVNRHTFHPDHGRASSRRLSIEAVEMIKDMNMNAVRMSHYPPDEHFLDACDSLGLLVLDELAGWQAPSYDSAVGHQLLKAMIRRDHNHPSVILWDNANEGGWNTALDGLFAEYDLQDREVLHPWANFGKINTAHYIGYSYLARGHFAGRDIFLPTEFLHGLYDGGHGAGLEDYWSRMWADPLCAGGFLWVLADEAILRTDLKELDSDGNHAPDGILGPYGEKEGSFYTIRELWSPVQIAGIYPAAVDFDGVLRLENRFHFTNFTSCEFSYSLEKFSIDYPSETQLIASGSPGVDPLEPGESGYLRLPAQDTEWQIADVLNIEAHDPHGRLIHRWSWPLKSPAAFLPGRGAYGIADASASLDVSEDADAFELATADLKVRISKSTGLLEQVSRSGKVLPLSRGPVYLEEQPPALSSSLNETAGMVSIRFDLGKGQYLIWRMHAGGALEMDMGYHPSPGKGNNYALPWAGVSFSLPEDPELHVSLLGRGPYRVWKNRMKGPQFGLWEKPYNNTITGHSGFDYPEFKGYYADLYAAAFKKGNEELFTIRCGSEDIFLRLYAPEEAPKPANTTVSHPKGDLGFMHGIPAIGTKFKKTEHQGPQSFPWTFDDRRVQDGLLRLHLFFEF